jgi:hypothetical protein
VVRASSAEKTTGRSEVSFVLLVIGPPVPAGEPEEAEAKVSGPHEALA